MELQGGKFDIPDRMFHDVGHCWNLSSKVRADRRYLVLIAPLLTTRAVRLRLTL